MESNATSVNQSDKILVIACGAIAREILAIVDANGLGHIELTCLPAMWHNHPEKIAPGVEDAIKQAREAGTKRIFVAYAECGTGGEIDTVCEKFGVERLAGPHCFSFFAGNEVFAQNWDDDMTSFFLTDFLARQFDAFIVQPLGLDRHPDLRDMYFGNYEKLIYVAQTKDAELEEKARAAAARLKLTYEYRFVGYGDLTEELTRL